ncbi:MAG: hypothetical protein M3Z64_00040 [Verrucomicrobiota bacterium]|nr:hypothetical protein [Verrucomicrobiota bacterium]
MTQYLIKVLVSAIIIVGVTELSKRGETFSGGGLASLPLTSLDDFVRTPNRSFIPPRLRPALKPLVRPAFRRCGSAAHRA